MKALLSLVALAVGAICSAPPATLREGSPEVYDTQDANERLQYGVGCFRKPPGHEKEPYGDIQSPYEDDVMAADTHTVLGE